MKKTIKVADKQTVDAMQRAIDEITEELRDVKEKLEETAKISQIINSSVVTEPGFIADARLMNPLLETSPLYGFNQRLSDITRNFKTVITLHDGDSLDKVLAETSDDKSVSLYLAVTSGESITNIPTGFNYSAGFILNRYGTEKAVILFNVFNSSGAKIIVNTYSTATWSGWKEL